MVEPKGKGTMNPLKRRAEFGAPMGEKLMADAIRAQEPQGGWQVCKHT